MAARALGPSSAALASAAATPHTLLAAARPMLGMSRHGGVLRPAQVRFAQVDFFSKCRNYLAP
jgi:hypothetical protein